MKRDAHQKSNLLRKGLLFCPSSLIIFGHSQYACSGLSILQLQCIKKKPDILHNIAFQILILFQSRMYFHPKILQPQSIVDTRVQGQYLEYSGCITLYESRNRRTIQQSKAKPCRCHSFITSCRFIISSHSKSLLNTYIQSCVGPRPHGVETRVIIKISTHTCYPRMTAYQGN